MGKRKPRTQETPYQYELDRAKGNKTCRICGGSGSVMSSNAAGDEYMMRCPCTPFRPVVETRADPSELCERYCDLYRAVEKFRVALRNEEDVEDDGRGGVRPNEAMKWLMRLDQIIEDGDVEDDGFYRALILRAAALALRDGGSANPLREDSPQSWAYRELMILSCDRGWFKDYAKEVK